MNTTFNPQEIRLIINKAISFGYTPAYVSTDFNTLHVGSCVIKDDALYDTSFDDIVLNFKEGESDYVEHIEVEADETENGEVIVKSILIPDGLNYAGKHSRIIFITAATINGLTGQTVKI